MEWTGRCCLVNYPLPDALTCSNVLKHWLWAVCYSLLQPRRHQCYDASAADVQHYRCHRVSLTHSSSVKLVRDSRKTATTYPYTKKQQDKTSNTNDTPRDRVHYSPTHVHTVTHSFKVAFKGETTTSLTSSPKYTKVSDLVWEEFHKKLSYNVLL